MQPLPLIKTEAEANRGFSLLEVVIAMAILVIALTALYQSYTSGVRAVSAVDAYTRAQILAESLLARVAADKINSPHPGSGRIGDLAWRISVSPAPVAIAGGPLRDDFVLYRITIAVTLPPRRTIELQTLKLAPRQPRAEIRE